MTERLWFKIGEAAAAVGVSPQDVRYWEKVIPEISPRRSQGNLRYYHIDDLPKLVSIAAWIKEGFSVADCRELFLTGRLNRALGLDIEEPNTEAPQVKTPKTAKSKLNIKSKTGISGEAADESIAINQKKIPAQQLEEVIDSLRKLLSSLQNPVTKSSTGYLHE
ncbi:MAG: MerR family transcriptional regulator [Holophagales bacterium]|jgi:DNA-binding transcriptional MerR regulator|nr:MerR family transcriptional regulator [Holophagales bacterium]